MKELGSGFGFREELGCKVRSKLMNAVGVSLGGLIDACTSPTLILKDIYVGFWSFTLGDTILIDLLAKDMSRAPSQAKCRGQNWGVTA